MAEPEVNLTEMETAIIRGVTAVNVPGNSGAEPKLSHPLNRERWKTHGNFKDNARLSQALKKIGHEAPGWGKMTDVMREVYDQEMMKWSRILSGRSDYREHWEDIGGYNNLQLEDMR